MKKISVLLVDDHSMVRQGIRQLLELETDIKVIGEASDGEQAIELIQKLSPDVILMDINMPKMNGLKALTEIKQRNVNVKIIMLTIHQDREYLIKTIQLGAEGYVLKDADSKILVEAIRSVNLGEKYIQSNMTSELIEEFNRVAMQKKSKKSEPVLTQREIEVLRLIAEGKLNKEIALSLYISEKTVKNHVSNIFKKLNVQDRTQAAIYALKNNLLENDNNDDI